MLVYIVDLELEMSVSSLILVIRLQNFQVEAKKAVPRDDQQILNRNMASLPGSPILGRTKKIFVGGLPSTVNEIDFKRYFDQFGMITDVVVMYDHNTQRPRGFGFITYNSEEAVDLVLHKTFHELNGKLVEVKRAVPKELSPGPARNTMMGYGYNSNRAHNFLSSFAQRYNMTPVGGFGVRMDGRFGINPLATARSGFSPVGAAGFGVGMNLEGRLSPTYTANSNLGNNLGYGRIIGPYYSGNSSRYSSTPIGISGAGGRNDSVLNSTTWNVWGNGGHVNNADLGSGSGNFGVSLGNDVANWGPITSSSFNSANIASRSGDGGYGIRGGGFGRNSSAAMAPTSSLGESSAGYEGSYGDLYRTGSVYGESTWQSNGSDIEGSGPFTYGLRSITADVSAKSSEGLIGNYSINSRQPNRGIIFFTFIILLELL